MAHQVALTNSYDHILEVWKEWGELTGRHYQAGGDATAPRAPRFICCSWARWPKWPKRRWMSMRDEGLPVGLVKIRLWRPFPFADMREAVAGAELVIVCDRALSLGGAAHPVLAEVRSALYPLADRPQILGTPWAWAAGTCSPRPLRTWWATPRRKSSRDPARNFTSMG